MFRKKQYILSFFTVLILSFLFSVSVNAQSAQPLQFGKEISGEITDSNLVYSITLEKPGLVSVDFDSYIDDRVDIHLENSAGEMVFDGRVYSGKPSNPRNWRNSEYLEAGTYFIHVKQQNNDTGKFDLNVNFEATNNNEVEPNNGKTQAQSLAFNEKITGLISWSDDTDTFKLTLDEPGKINLEFDSYIDDSVDIYLEDSNGEKVFGKIVYNGLPKNPLNWIESEYLEAGTYYIHVNKNELAMENTGKYDLIVGFEPTNNNESEPNNGKVQAETLPFNKKITGLISWNDNTDTFKLDLDEPGKINVEFNSYIDNSVDIQLVDSNGKRVLRQRVNSGLPTNPKTWIDSEYLEAGTYYIHVDKVLSYTGQYGLEVGFKPTNNNEIEPNNGKTQAQPLSFNSRLTGLISWSDDTDTYKITLKEDDEITFDFNSNIDYSVNVMMEDHAGNQVFNKYVTNGTPSNPKNLIWTDDLKAGTYYIHVNKQSGTGTYDLSVINVHFDDIVHGSYYYDSVVKLTSKGIISGYPDGDFHPNDNIPRWQAILLLKRSLNLDIPTNYKDIAERFTDVGKNHTYAKEIAAVYETGIFEGYNNVMGLNDLLTREQMASVVVRAFDLKGNPDADSLVNVVDAKQIEDYHRKDVKTLYDLGITTGTGNGKYSPQASITRAEFVTFIDRVMK